MPHIITEGIAPTQRVHEATCSTCGTRFSFKQWEAKHNSDQREGDYLSINCPLTGCGRLVTKQLHPAPSASYWDR